MSPTKAEQAEILFRALVTREEELRVNEALIKKAAFRSHTLRAAIAELRATITKLMGDAPAEDISSIAAVGPRPGLVRAEDSILSRVEAYVETTPRVCDAKEISDALSIGIEVTRTSLSKLYSKGAITRVDTGRYCSMKHSQQIASEAVRGRAR